MSEDAMDTAREAINEVYSAESRRVLATLIRLLGDFDLAEEALHEAFAAAIEQWPRDGMPANPRAWLVSTGRFKAIDAMRRRARYDATLGEYAREYDSLVTESAQADDQDIDDDRLRLIFTCCHPALSPEAQIPLTLREVCGLTTEELEGSSGQKRRYATLAYLTKYRRHPNSPNGLMPSCASSISSLTRGIPHPQGKP
jgi:RNA polymerase sigma-70 factor (ECF subfamily)